LKKSKTLKQGGLKMKKILVVVIALSMLLGLFVVRPASVNAAGFKDVPGDYWAAKRINYLVSKNVVAGFPDGTFKPESPVTREQFAKMVCIAKGIKEYKPSTATFKDVNSSRWSYGFVEAAAKAGYIKGYPDGTFGPDKNITRQELAVLGVRVVGKEKEASGIKESICFANDEDKIASWAVGAMTIAVRPKIQLLSWDNFRNLRPTAAGTRAECAYEIYAIMVPPGTNGKTDIVELDEEGPENFFAVTSSSAYTLKAVTYMKDELVGATPTGVAFPQLATAVPTITNGQLKLNDATGEVETIFKLRHGLKWADGAPLTMQDVVFGYNMYMAPEIEVVSRYPYDLITSIKAIDDYTLDIKWSAVDAYEVLGVPVYPKHILGPIFDKNPADINTADFGTKNPVYNGPYMLDVYVSGQYYTLKPNPYWYGGEPVFKKITARIIQDTNTQFANMLAGGIDSGSEILTLDLAEKVEQQLKDFNVYYNKGTSFGIMQMNTESDFFKDVRVRKAFYYAIDRALLVQRARVGYDPALSLIPAGTWAFKNVLGQYKYDPDMANKLLDEAGWKWNADHTQRILPNGQPAVLKFPYAVGATFREREVTIMEPMLAAVGIKAEHDPMDFNALLDSEDRGTFTITLHGISYDQFDPTSGLVSLQTNQIPTEENGWSGQNVPRNSNAELDQLVPQALKEAFKPTTDRVATLSKIQEVWAEEAPFILLEQRVYPDFVRKGLQNWNHFFCGTVYYDWMCPWWFFDNNLK
jgi:peptide/nickel transport system substrate-binding protein